MKKSFILIAIVLYGWAYSQVQGQQGALLKNESSEKIRTAKVQEKMSGRNPLQGFENQYNSLWNFSRTRAEVFVTIPTRSNYTVEVNDQSITNSTGKYRFFDLDSGTARISIYQGRHLIYRTSFYTDRGTRTLLGLTQFGELRIIDVVPISNESFTPWPHIPAINPGVMGDRNFRNFMAALQKNAFDDGKMSFLNSQLRNSFFTSNQIKQILGSFAFDDKRLVIAKSLYHNCLDKENFYVVYDVFAFDSNRRQLMDFVAQQSY